MSGRVLITGASGALGRSVVRRFLAAGESVLASGRSAAALDELRALAPPERLAVRIADLTATAEVAALFDHLAENPAGEGEVEEGETRPVVVHLAGGFRFGRLKDFGDDDWNALVGINLETAFRVLRECARRFEAARGGVAVVVASPAALLGAAGVGAYAATKAGVLRLVESLARETAPAGGRANAVLPGTLDTAANRAAMPGADRSRWVEPDAVAGVIHFLTTPEAAAINGAAVPVEGTQPSRT
jgi:NAD(P)-dependent dehydrogenase (short-subunit alcohol dehydrogenase family)